jgi:peptide-methionine (S)-S-oxide reductase
MSETETATLGGGCFWCVEAIYLNLKGVHRAVSGYSGGTVPNPNYRQVCTGTTGHAEVVQIRFDPNILSFRDVLHVFWRTHDPTTRNRQGADVGTQYRSAIFYHDERQRAEAEVSRKETEDSGLWPGPIVTEIVPFRAFYDAEDYHQDYFRLNPGQPYCLSVIDPKMRKFRAAFEGWLKPSAP